MTSVLTTLLLMVLLALPGIVAVRVSGYFFGEAEWWRRAFAAACIYPLYIYAVLMLLAPFALMKVWPVLLVMVLLSALSMAIPPVPWRFKGLDEKYFQPWWQVAVACGFVAAAFGVFFYSNYITGTAYMSDDYAYHGPTISAWFRTGTLDHPRQVFVSYYPFNAHLITLYTIFPTGDLRWTWVATFVWLALGSASLLVLARCLPRYTFSWALLTAAIFLICREVSWHHFYTLSPSDVSGAVAFFAALVVAIPRPGATVREALARVALASMMLGFAMGTKATFAAPGVAAAIGVTFLTLFGASPLSFWRRLGTTLGLGTIGAFSTGSYWYLWNWVHAKNPVFPARIWNFRGPGHDRWWGDTKLIYHIKNAPDNSIHRQIWDQAIDWPPALGIMSLLGIFACMGFIAWLLWRAVKTRSTRPLGHPMLWLFAAGSVLIIQYPFMPYTGSFDDVTGPDLWINHRYFIVFFMVGVVTVCWGLSSLTTLIRDSLWSKVTGAVSFLAVAYIVWYCFPANGQGIGNTQSGLAQITGLLVAVVLLALQWAPIPTPLVLGTRALIGVFAGMSLVVLLLGSVRERVLPPPYMSVIDISWTRVIPGMIEAIDTLPPGSRIGEYSMMGWEYWYLHGSRMQHIPVLLWDKGHAMIPLHEAYYAGMIDEGYPRLGMRRVGYLPNPDTFADNLRQVDLDYIFISRYLTGVLDDVWPIQRPYIQAMPEFELVWSNENSEIYRRLPTTAVEGNSAP